MDGLKYSRPGGVLLDDGEFLVRKESVLVVGTYLLLQNRSRQSLFCSRPEKYDCYESDESCGEWLSVNPKSNCRDEKGKPSSD